MWLNCYLLFVLQKDVEPLCSDMGSIKYPQSFRSNQSTSHYTLSQNVYNALVLYQPYPNCTSALVNAV